MTTRPQAILDVSRMVVTPQGVDNFQWPVGFQEIHDVRDAVIYPLAEQVSQAYQAGTPGGVELAMLTGHLVLEAMTLYQAHACLNRLDRMGFEAVLPQGLVPTWEAVARGRQPATPPLLDVLVAGHGFRSLGERMAKAWAARFGKPVRAASEVPKPHEEATDPVALDTPPRELPAKRIHSRTVFHGNLDRIIVCTRRGRLQSVHAVSAPKPVILFSHDRWFRPLERSRVEQAAGTTLSPDMVDMVLDCVGKGFSKGGETLPGYLAEYLRRFMLTCSAALRLHLDGLRRRPKRLPRELWTGTGGNTWDVMLRAVVREFGGRSVGHSHSGGFGHLTWPFICFYEFPFLDAFVVYSDLQAEMTRKFMDSRLLTTGMVPEVLAPPALRGPIPARPSREVSPRPVRRVMVVTTSIFAKDRLNLAPAIPDPVAVDWQARLFAHLREWGYEILHKPHPESFLPAPQAYQDQFGVTKVEGRFEKTCNCADLFLFDTQSSTTFPVALRSTKPMVFVDLNRFTWESQAYDLLRKRCAVVPAGFGTDNRIEIDWEGLRQAIEAAPALAGDRGLADRYFG